MQTNPSHHTKRVKRLRRILLGAALLAVASLVGLSNLDRFSERQGLSGTLSLSQDGPAIDRPDYQGRTASGRDYRLTGANARADTQNATLLNLPVLALAALADNPAVTMTADLARLQNGTDAVMQGNVRVHMGDGHVLQTETLEAELDAQMLSVPSKLSIDGPQLRLDADSLEGRLDTEIFTFTNTSMT